MSKQSLTTVMFVILVTAANVYLWLDIVQGGPAPRAGKIVALIIGLAAGALFSDKVSNKQYVPEFVKAGCIIGMTVMFFILLNRTS
jgi:hypothetical protein